MSEIEIDSSKGKRGAGGGCCWWMGRGVAPSMACLGDGESWVRAFSWRCSADLGSCSFFSFLRSLVSPSISFS